MDIVSKAALQKDIAVINNKMEVNYVEAKKYLFISFFKSTLSTVDKLCTLLGCFLNGIKGLHILYMPDSCWLVSLPFLHIFSVVSNKWSNFTQS